MQADVSGCRPTLECCAVSSSGQTLDSVSADSRGPHWLPSPLRPIQAWVQGAVMLCGAAAGGEGTVVCSTTAAEFGFTLGVVLSCTNTLDATFPSEGGVCGNQPDSCVFLAEAYSDLKVCLQGQAPQGFMLKPSTVLRPQVTPHLSLNIKLSQNRF